jgi:GrpB-like predicted nucleotidyltransferase (UPF0157 family)
VIEIVEYQERWPLEFAALVAELRAALGDLALRVDHIGSTSVPGLAAKDRIDVQVTVARDADLDAALERLAQAGFQARPFNTTDHVPPGATGSPMEWIKRFAAQRPDERPANIHLRVQGRANQRYPLLFRDYLREHPASAAAYAELKRRLAANLHDVATYADVKDPACDIIMVAAESWAAATGWSAEPSEGQGAQRTSA